MGVPAWMTIFVQVIEYPVLLQTLSAMPSRSDHYFAHSAPSENPSSWHRLDDHLRHTGDRAAGFLERVGLAHFGRAAGLLHDLGKYTEKFQQRLRGGPRVNHSTAGAKIACERYPGIIGKMLAFGVAGHHAGLANGVNGEKITALADRLRENTPELDPLWSQEIQLPPLGPPQIQSRSRENAGFSGSFLIRLLFSALVDADYLDTEAYYARIEKTSPSRGGHPSLGILRDRLDAHLEGLTARASASEVNALRREVLHHARKRAVDTPGLFTLTVPTGGGKTLTSLSFALHHAVHHGLDRILYVIPYMNIIEQTAAVFRDVLQDDESEGPHFVIEHHSTFDEQRVEKRSGKEKLRLAMENWDAPIVVTTAVQFFESLFSNRPSRCRKLHNIAGSVVVLDEAQTLPLEFLRPCVAAMDELARNWRATVVLCSATQPALREESGFCGGLREVRELAPQPTRLQRSLKRTRIHQKGPMEDSEITERLRGTPQALCIVNTRAHARALYEAIEDQDGATHLTTSMCARHRREILEEVRSRLTIGEPIRLIATSLVEAGVDLDFPVVWREEAGLESIIQAAGRCNREGKAPSGDVIVFRSQAGGRGLPEIRKAADAARQVLRKHQDPMSLPAIQEYFQTRYWIEGDNALDTKGILPMLRERKRSLDFPFETISRAFCLIETPMAPVIVPYRGREGKDRTADRLIAALEHEERPGWLARSLQPYTVPVPLLGRKSLLDSRAARIIREADFDEQFVVLDNRDIYRADIGLTWDDPSFHSVEGLIC